jgi:hypothetical protein
MCNITNITAGQNSYKVRVKEVFVSQRYAQKNITNLQSLIGWSRLIETIV